MARVTKTMAVIRPWSPEPPFEVQKIFLGLEAEEVLFGGAAGGGKSSALLLAALQYVDVPGYSAGIFRLTKADMLKPESILSRANAWFAGTRAWWDESEHSWKFPTKGAPASIHFGYATSLKDVSTRYQGPEFQFIGIDELTQWKEPVYRYLFSRLRRKAGVAVPIRMRASCNPGGVGHEWVKRRFVEYAKHVGTGSDVRADIKAFRHNNRPMPAPRLYASPPSEDAIAAAESVGMKAEPAYFVPSFNEDNTGLDIKAYALQLARLDPVTREQLKNSDWDISHAGNFFKPAYFKIVDEVPAGLQWVRSWDFAATEVKEGEDPDFTAGAKMAVERIGDGTNVERRVWIADVRAFQEEPGPTEANVKATAESDGRRVTILIEQEPGSAGKSAVWSAKTRVLFGYHVVGRRRTGPKSSYWKPLSSIASAGNLYLVRGAWNDAFIKQLCALPMGHDDMADAVSLGFDFLVDEKAFAMERTRALARR